MNERKNEATHWHLALAMKDQKERTTLDVAQKAQMYSRRSKRKEPFSKTLNPPDKEMYSRSSIQAIIPPFILICISPATLPLLFGSAIKVIYIQQQKHKDKHIP